MIALLQQPGTMEELAANWDGTWRRRIAGREIALTSRLEEEAAAAVVIVALVAALVAVAVAGGTACSQHGHSMSSLRFGLRVGGQNPHKLGRRE